MMITTVENREEPKKTKMKKRAKDKLLKKEKFWKKKKLSQDYKEK